MTDPGGARLLDLHDVVPDPPDHLLDWGGLDARITRRRAIRSITAIAACIMLTAAVVVGAVAIGRNGTSTPVAVPTQSNGPLLFATIASDSPNAFIKTNLVLANADGSQKRLLTGGPGANYDIAVTPNGKEIAYVDETNRRVGNGTFQSREVIYEIGVDGSNDHAVYTCASDCNGLTWSPNGQQLAFADNGIKVLQPNEEVRVLCGQQCVSTAAEPAWSPDGKQLAFSQAGVLGEIGPIVSASAIWSMDSNGVGLQKLTDRSCTTAGLHCAFDTGPAWSPNGHQIAFSRFPVPKPLSRASPVLSPTQPNGVFVMTATGGRVHQVWRCPHQYCEELSPSWSPDGTRLAFRGSDPPGNAVVVAASGGQPTVIAPPGNDGRRSYSAVVWSPDGTRLALLLTSTHREVFAKGRREAGAIFTVKPNGSSLTRLPIANVYDDSVALVWAAASSSGGSGGSTMR